MLCKKKKCQYFQNKQEITYFLTSGRSLEDNGTQDNAMSPYPSCRFPDLWHCARKYLEEWYLQMWFLVLLYLCCHVAIPMRRSDEQVMTCLWTYDQQVAIFFSCLYLRFCWAFHILRHWLHDPSSWCFVPYGAYVCKCHKVIFLPISSKTMLHFHSVKYTLWWLWTVAVLFLFPLYVSILWRDAQAREFLVSIYLFWSHQLPRYLTFCSPVLSTKACLIWIPPAVIITWMSLSKQMLFVFFAFISNPTFLHYSSSLFTSILVWSISFWRSTILSAK